LKFLDRIQLFYRYEMKRLLEGMFGGRVSGGGRGDSSFRMHSRSHSQVVLPQSVHKSDKEGRVIIKSSVGGGMKTNNTDLKFLN
jgi:hypothetical protein